MQIVGEASLKVWQDISEMGMFNLIPVMIALIFICLASLLKEPARRNFNAVMIAGAGAAYLSGGFGLWEFVFTSGMTFVAYRGLQSYRWIGVGWLLHTGWDLGKRAEHTFTSGVLPRPIASRLPGHGGRRSCWFWCPARQSPPSLRG